MPGPFNVPPSQARYQGTHENRISLTGKFVLGFTASLRLLIFVGIVSIHSTREFIRSAGVVAQSNPSQTTDMMIRLSVWLAGRGGVLAVSHGSAAMPSAQTSKPGSYPTFFLDGPAAAEPPLPAST